MNRFRDRTAPRYSTTVAQLATTSWTLPHTVAEGVEHPAQLDELRGLGCSLGQGYHFARPLSADAIGELLEGRVAWEEVDVPVATSIADASHRDEAA